MTISELIERLEALKAEHGDLTIVTYDQMEDAIEPDPYLGQESFPTDETYRTWLKRTVVKI